MLKEGKKVKSKNSDYFQIEKPYTLSQAIIEADRCLLCYDSPCSKACPAETDPGRFIKKLRLRNLKGAAKTIKENNILGGICGLVCPVDKLCEEACLAIGIDRAINIGKLQRFLVEYSWDIGFNPLNKKRNKNVNVAIIGSGPAGLTCAGELAKEGYNVTIFEKNEKPGGILRYGIPPYKLNDEFLDREIKDILDLGVKIKTNYEFKGKGSIEKLLNDGFNAVFISTGLQNPYRLKILGSNSKNVFTYNEFLWKINDGKVNEVSKEIKNKNVAIIGGGSVAMDVGITCKKLNANNVYCISLESMEDLPSDRQDLHKAIDHHIAIKPQSQVKEIITKNGKVVGVKGNEIKLLKKGDFSPSNIKDIEGTDFSFNVDYVIFAIGYGVDPKIKEYLPTVKFDEKGHIMVNKSYETSVKGIFAGGEIVSGPGLVVNAVKDGKNAAKSIIKFLNK
jgi:NADPH-dependent glutamate synthase beta subunit-like oxidoreductase